MRANLVCSPFRRLMALVKKIAIGFAFAMVLLALSLFLCGVYDSPKTGILCSMIMLGFSVLLLIPGFYYEKVSQSSASLTESEIHILDKKGRCWRVVPIERITALQVKEIAGFFYGKNGQEAKDTYLCIFLNGATEIPEVSYHKLFFQENFFLVSYDKAFAEHLSNITGRQLQTNGF